MKAIGIDSHKTLPIPCKIISNVEILQRGVMSSFEGEDSFTFFVEIQLGYNPCRLRDNFLPVNFTALQRQE
jgi:hypothetical protein